MHLHLVPLGGLAGDMFCAALLDAYPRLLPLARETLDALGRPQGWDLQLQKVAGPPPGCRFLVAPGGGHHHHTSYREIRRLLTEAPLAEGVRERALRVFALLAEAEGAVHGRVPDEVEFHELGSWDSLADILTAATLLDALQVKTVSCEPLPLGGGRVQTAHGVLPVPAPATARLLQGLPVLDDGIPGERVTPTGAAILQSLAPGAGRPRDGILGGTGVGFGTRVLDGVPNCVQVLCLDPSPARPLIQGQLETDQVAELCFEVDDQTPEDLGVALERLRATAGVLSLTSFVGTGKAGRPTWSLAILARPASLEQVADACFRETTTLGLRWRLTSRYLLPRRSRRLDLEGGVLNVKLADRPGGVTAKAEIRDLAGQGDHRQRQQRRALGERLALHQELDHD